MSVQKDASRKFENKIDGAFGTQQFKTSSEKKLKYLPGAICYKVVIKILQNIVSCINLLLELFLLGLLCGGGKGGG